MKKCIYISHLDLSHKCVYICVRQTTMSSCTWEDHVELATQVRGWAHTSKARIVLATKVHGLITWKPKDMRKQKFHTLFLHEVKSMKK